MNPEKKPLLKTFSDALEELRQHPDQSVEIVEQGMTLQVTVVSRGKSGAKKMATPEEWDQLMNEAEPLFEGEEEDTMSLIREGRAKMTLREPPTL